MIYEIFNVRYDKVAGFTYDYFSPYLKSGLSSDIINCVHYHTTKQKWRTRLAACARGKKRLWVNGNRHRHWHCWPV